MDKTIRAFFLCRAGSSHNYSSNNRLSEDFNKKWLLHTGAGIFQENPKYTDQWFFDLLNAGDFS